MIKLNLQLNDDLFARVEGNAKRQGISVSDYLENVLAWELVRGAVPYRDRDEPVTVSSTSAESKTPYSAA